MKLCAKLPNGEQITAPLEQWVSALIGTLSERDRNVLFERMKNQTKLYTTPGHHVLHAEGFKVGWRP